MIGGEAHLQIAIHAGAGMQGAGGADGAVGQVGLGQGQGVALTDQRGTVDHPVAREIGHLGPHLIGA
ncbi:hypothetical protein D3C85_917130 [compost metagenome]